MPGLVLSRSGRALPLPPTAMRFMREDDERLIAVADELAGLLVEHGLSADGSVLDIGSGYGRLALGILHSLDYRGRYLGFDILPRHVAWCAATITPTFPMMRFEHLDIRNERYNPAGSLDPATVGFPAASAQTEFCALFSVFTHLHRPVVERYLHEIHRVLRPGGTAVTTWFLFDAARLPAITSNAATYPMVHELDAGQPIRRRRRTPAGHRLRRGRRPGLGGRGTPRCRLDRPRNVGRRARAHLPGSRRAPAGGGRPRGRADAPGPVAPNAGQGGGAARSPPSRGRTAAPALGSGSSRPGHDRATTRLTG